MIYNRKDQKTTSMMSDKSRVIEAIGAGESFIVAPHVQPDGDAIGAALGLTFLLEELGKTAVIAMDPAMVQAKYQWLPGVDRVAQPKRLKADTLIAVDVATEDRLGDNKAALAAVETVINIDHHPDNSHFGQINWVEPTATSASQMVLDIWQGLDRRPSVDAAVCIYTGMLTDTGNWQYSNTTGEALRAAADLLDIGVKPNVLFSHLYESNSIGWLRLMGLGLTSTVLDTDLRFAYVVITRTDLEAAGALSNEVDSLVDSLRSLEAVDSVLVIKEAESGEFKGSARSRGLIDVSEMARLFGGGGHHNAAGFTTIVAPSRIIAKVKKWLKKTASS